MLRILFAAVVLIFSVYAGCPDPHSLYNTTKLKCPTCKYFPVAHTLHGSGNLYTVICPSNNDLWFYNTEGREFVIPMSKVNTKGIFNCEGSHWKISVPGQTQVLSAYFCATLT